MSANQGILAIKNADTQDGNHVSKFLASHPDTGILEFDTGLWDYHTHWAPLQAPNLHTLVISFHGCSERGTLKCIRWVLHYCRNIRTVVLSNVWIYTRNRYEKLLAFEAKLEKLKSVFKDRNIRWVITYRKFLVQEEDFNPLYRGYGDRTVSHTSNQLVRLFLEKAPKWDQARIDIHFHKTVDLDPKELEAKHVTMVRRRFASDLGDHDYMVTLAYRKHIDE